MPLVKVQQTDEYGNLWYLYIDSDALKVDCKYKCIKCNHEWVGKRGGMDGNCPRCKNLYYKWINYEDMKNNKFS